MRKDAILGICLLFLVGAIVGISGCTSSEPTDYETPTDVEEEPVESEPVETEPVSTSPSTPASECPVCYMEGIYQADSDTYACEDCGIVWIADAENGVKMCSSVLDYMDDYQITEDEVYFVPWT